MATLEDKILGEKLEYFCSSDEEVEDDDDADNDDDEFDDAVSDLCATEIFQPKLAANSLPVSKTQSNNTGPKGVIKDWQRFKQLETEKRIENERERVLLAQKLSMTCQSTLDAETEDDEFADLLSDKILLEFAEKRMQELMTQDAPEKKFGNLIHLKSGEEYLDAIDKELKSVTVVLHVFENYIVSCRTMNECLEELSKSYPCVKFCKMSASTAGLSSNFKSVGVPAILVYKAGDLIGNFVQLGDEFGTDFIANDVENFFLEKGITLSYTS